MNNIIDNIKNLLKGKYINYFKDFKIKGNEVFLIKKEAGLRIYHPTRCNCLYIELFNNKNKNYFLIDNDKKVYSIDSFPQRKEISLKQFYNNIKNFIN